MIFSAGVRLGPYEIEAPVGAGGMGEVYRARDTRLDRTVAIKVLPAGATARPELRQRFEREARTISSLNHPHICALYDVGQQDGTDFLVMEYLEGETLGHRLVRGPLPTEQVLRLGREIADALDKAHRQRIVHRDLKPANIMLTKAGVKLMDFGLAKLTQTTSPVVATLSRMTTQDSRITEEGVIVGTFQYMAPEQLEGHEADPRSDIFAFGAVLYEMVTGRPAFQGKMRASLIAAILSSEPAPMAQLQPLTPPALDRVVKACLAKDPDQRIQTAHDVLLELKWIAEAGSEAGVPAPVAGRRKIRERLAWVLAVFFFVTTVIAIIDYVGRAPGPERAVRFEIVPSANILFGDFNPQRVSPDGRMIAFIAGDASGRQSLWVRTLDSSEPRKLQSVEKPAGMAWSPDNRTLIWLDEGKVRRIDVTGGPPETVCSVQTQGGLVVN
ncbi:MAG: protein kinase domain-containing protein, partial [Terriglobales bacterium]